MNCWLSTFLLCRTPRGKLVHWLPLLRSLMRDFRSFHRSYQTHFRRLMPCFSNATFQLHNHQTKGRVQPSCPRPAPFKEPAPNLLLGGPSAPGEHIFPQKNEAKMTMKLAYWDIRGVSLFASGRQLKAKEAADVFS